jgi:hypothetical protein
MPLRNVDEVPSTTRRAGYVVLTAVVLVGGLVGCGGLKTATSSSASSTTASTSPPSTTVSSTSQQPPAAGAVFDVTIANGQVTPTNASWQAKVGQPITVRVTSDATDELHVHSVPDHEFEIVAAPNQTFQFSVDTPGDVEVELHHLDRTVATIQVRP